MGDGFPTVRLNSNQRRHFEVLLARLEDSLSRIENLLQHQEPSQHALSIAEDDIPDAFRTDAPPRLQYLRQKVATLAQWLALEPRPSSQRRIIQATLTSEAVRVEDSLGRRMRGYGTVDPTVHDHLDPELDVIAATLKELAASLDHRRQGRRVPGE